MKYIKLFVALALVGCGESHTSCPSADAGPTISDANPSVTDAPLAPSDSPSWDLTGEAVCIAFTDGYVATGADLCAGSMREPPRCTWSPTARCWVYFVDRCLVTMDAATTCEEWRTLRDYCGEYACQSF